jgi:hypothetical protein
MEFIMDWYDFVSRDVESKIFGPTSNLKGLNMFPEHNKWTGHCYVLTNALILLIELKSF